VGDRLRRSVNDLLDAMLSQNNKTLPALTLPGLTMTGPVLLADGTLANPGAAFASDPDTGQRHVSAEQAALVAGASDVLTWLNGANGIGVGIGVVPQAALHISKSQVSSWVAVIEQLAAAAGSKGLRIVLPTTAAPTVDPILQLESPSGTVKFGVMGDGSIATKGGEPLQKAPVGAACSANTTLSALPTWTDVTGCSITLTIGRWTVLGVLYCSEVGAGDVGNLGVAQIVAGTATATINRSTSVAVCPLQTASQVSQGMQVWDIQVTVAGSIKLQCAKGGGTGSSTANATHTTLTATYAGNV
jgi:hypothetical protein